EAMVRTTTALTIFNAGDKDNVLPGKAAATVNFRLLPGDTQASVVDHVRSTVENDGISVDPFPGNTDPPPVTGTASPSFKMLHRTIREIFPDVIVAPGLMVAATDSRHYTEITDKIFRFSPVRANSDDLKRFHGTNERLSIEGYADMIRFYRRLIENSAGGRRSRHTPGFGNPWIAHAARSVFTSKHATVICPTPPGTGVIAPATLSASVKATSPTRRVLPSAAGRRLMPTSITVAPGLIQSPRTISALPTAASTSSARSLGLATFMD